MILGIDLGTTYSLCSYFDGKESRLIPNASGSMLTPSVVYLGEGEEYSVGYCPDPEKFPGKFSFFKEYMGSKKEFSHGGRSFSPVELSAMVLRQLKADGERFLGEAVTEAVISVPAYFSDKQRVATKQAGELAGLATSRIVNEPSAAALAYQFGYDESSLLVFDFGGGTVDVSVVDCFDNIIEIRAIAGDNHLGGKDVDRLLGDYFCSNSGISRESLTTEEEDKLRSEMELLKESLCQVPQILYEFQGKAVMFDRSLLESICHPVYQKLGNLLAKVLWDSEKTPKDMDAVILVGGSSHLYGLSKFIGEMMGIEPICSLHPQTVVAMGMGYYVGMKARSGEVKDLILTDVCPFTLGVSSVYGKEDENPHMTPLIPRNSTLPATKRSHFITVSENQTAFELKIIQGENYLERDNERLGMIHFPVEPAPAGKQEIQVSFTYDLNGIIQVEIFHEESGRRLVTAVSSSAHEELSDHRLQESMERLSQYRLIQQENSDEIMSEGNRIFALLPPGERKLLGEFLRMYTESRASGLVETRKQERRLRYLMSKLQEWSDLRFQSLEEDQDFLEFFREEMDEGFSYEEFFSDQE